ncbi:amino acid adenylation domain-containing protein [Lentzea xinjiangensis]|uniref:Amino acid adenylation domain-containing protein n=1 Tax=Lentzea xinjiangensis TaxID=402600 RepID=A0A1H9WMV5_9PSEU|nr:non-ribosomal peptide synthetase [Lentzea xinjiangensis]SES35099.1 amino acid adenylation domain-containing protein [Lentzea xinjiangensis]
MSNEFAVPVVHQMFARQARRTPDARAVFSDDTTLTYAELDRRANRLAHHLLGLGAGRGDLVGLRVRRSVDSVVAMLAVLKTGAAYVPLEDGLPDDRLTVMAAECAVPLVVVGGGLRWTLTPAPVVRVDDPAIAVAPDTDPGVEVSPDDLCYVPYTSGSTGRPKGTLVCHRNVPGFFAGDGYADWGPGAVAVHHSAQSWDGHVLDVYPALLSGGALAVYQGDATDPVAVVRWAAARGATVLWLTAAAFNAVVNVDPALLTGVRYLMAGGESLSVPHVAAAAAALPGTRIVNGYGPSECTVFSCVREIEPADLTAAAIPIGRAVGDRVVSVVDERGDAVPAGTVGELCVGGDAVSRGYLGRPAMTAERFVPDPGGPPGARRYRTGDHVRRRPDGALEFVGRTDGQVKIRGMRVELDEVAAAMRARPGVVDAAAVVRERAPGDPVLVGYLVMEPGADHDADHDEELRTSLGAALPAAMVPTAFVRLAALPLTRNGKLDRAALPEPAGPGADVRYEAPVGATEAFLASTWQEVLAVPRVGRGHDFFRLGGHSLAATQVVSRIRGRWGVELRVRDVYDAPRLADLAAVTDRAVTAGAAAPTAIGRAARATRTRATRTDTTQDSGRAQC